MFFNCVRLEDINVKFGPNPADRIAVITQFATLAATNNQVSTPFAPGTTVLVVPLATATVDANGDVLLTPNPEPGTGTAGGYIVLGLGHQTQGGIRD